MRLLCSLILILCLHNPAMARDFIDFTKMTPILAYAQLGQLLLYGQDSVGTKIKITGLYGVFDSELDEGKSTYQAIVMSDAAKCCQQYLELEFDPALKDIKLIEGKDITVEGIYQRKMVGEIELYYLHVDKIL